jgi:ribokinase
VAGETVLAQRRDTAFGGKGGNQAAAAAACGAAVDMVGAVGRDDDGTRYVRALRERGVNTGGVTQLEGSPTGAAVIFVDDCGENLIVVDAGANAALRRRSSSQPASTANGAGWNGSAACNASPP